MENIQVFLRMRPKNPSEMLEEHFLKKERYRWFITD
jgi:hypothetical protein